MATVLSEKSFELHAGFKLLKKKRDALKAKFQAPWIYRDVHRSSEGEFFRQWLRVQAGLGLFMFSESMQSKALGPCGVL